nr:hypothetical protein [Tanacetum cinerariifolium]
ITMAKFLRLPNFKGCKITAVALLPPGAARVTYLAPPANQLEDIPPKSDQVSSSNPLNQAQPLEALADEGHVPPPLSAGRMDNLRDHPDEHVSPPLAALVTKLVAGERGDEGADDNEGVLSGLQARPSPAPPSEDIPPKSGEMLVAEIPYRKVLDDKVRKKKKAEEKTVAHASAGNTQAEVVIPKGASGEGRCKKKRVRIQPEMVVVS